MVNVFLVPILSSRVLERLVAKGALVGTFASAGIASVVAIEIAVSNTHWVFSWVSRLLS